MELRTILVPVDFTYLANREIRHAARLAERFDARVVIDHNLDPRPPGYLTVSWMWSEEHERAEEERTTRAERRLRSLMGHVPGSIRVEAKLTRGPIDLTLLHLARELPADLILMGSHGRSTHEHSSLTERVLVQAPCPVLTVAEWRGTEGLEHMMSGQFPILAPIRLPNRTAAATEAFKIARTFSARVILLHVDRGNAPLEHEKELSALVPADLEGSVDHLVRNGTAAEEILRAATELDAAMIVMGSRRGRFRRHPGPVARKILHDSRHPVWFVTHGGPAALDGVAA